MSSLLPDVERGTDLLDVGPDLGSMGAIDDAALLALPDALL